MVLSAEFGRTPVDQPMGGTGGEAGDRGWRDERVRVTGLDHELTDAHGNLVRKMLSRLGDEVGDDGAVDVGEAAVDAVVAVGEALVIDAEKVEHRRMDVVAVDGFFDGFVGPFVGGSVADAAFAAASG